MRSELNVNSREGKGSHYCRLHCSRDGLFWIPNKAFYDTWYMFYDTYAFDKFFLQWTFTIRFKLVRGRSQGVGRPLAFYATVWYSIHFFPFSSMSLNIHFFKYYNNKNISTLLWKIRLQLPINWSSNRLSNICFSSQLNRDWLEYSENVGKTWIIYYILALCSKLIWIGELDVARNRSWGQWLERPAAGDQEGRAWAHRPEWPWARPVRGRAQRLLWFLYLLNK